MGFEDIQKEIKKKEKALENAMKKNKQLGEGLKVGKIFRVRVADGYAFYEITEIKKRVVGIKWRKDLCVDNYQDMILANGGNFTIDTINRLITREDGLQKLFGG